MTTCEEQITCGDSAQSSTQDSANIQSCLTCGECVSRCFLTDGYPDMNPRKLVRKVVTGKVEEMADSEFIWACTMCGRCTTDCRENLNMEEIVGHLRYNALTRGKAPARLLEGIEKALEFGNNTGVDSEEFVEMAEWMAEEMADEMEGVEEGEIEVPFDVEGAEMLYVPNPREYTSNPAQFQTYLKFFRYTNTNWTLSSRVFDITNWGYYVGDRRLATQLVQNLVQEAERLKVKTLLSTECGHGFKILRKDAESWLGRKPEIEVISIVELAHRYLKEGRLPLKAGSVRETVTYHDPCNVGRKLGIYEEPRELIAAVADNFVEVWPNRKYSICCGGGGSVKQNPQMGTKRLEHARAKRDQILKTGAEVVVTSCQSCLSQLTDLQERYEMPVKVKSLIEFLVEAIENGAEDA